MHASSDCNYVKESNDAVLLVPWQSLRNLEWSRFRPTTEAILLQASILNIAVKTVAASVSKATFERGPNDLYTDNHKRSKRDYAQQLRRTELYTQFGVKLTAVARTSFSRQTPMVDKHYFGCTAQTARCFGTIHNDIPSYLVSNRWTPPCCLKNLKTTARHVFQRLDASKVRYWLEGGSLLGAIRSGDVIPWDYDVDVGIHIDDVNKCRELQLASEKGRYQTADGFVWERAIEGGFFRVQFSMYNHLHVDIFPFFEKDNRMDRHNKMKTHKQDTDFPSSFVNPLTRINFIGMNVSAPNHPVQFLELKFGKGVVENPQYPQSFQNDHKPSIN